MSAAWESLRAEVLHGVDGLDNDQVNIVLGLIDYHTPAEQPVGAVVAELTDAQIIALFEPYIDSAPTAPPEMSTYWVRQDELIAFTRAALAAQPAKPVDGGGAADHKCKLTSAELSDPEYVRAYIESQNESFAETIAELVKARAALAAQTAAPGVKPVGHVRRGADGFYEFEPATNWSNIGIDAPLYTATPAPAAPSSGTILNFNDVGMKPSTLPVSVKMPLEAFNRLNAKLQPTPAAPVDLDSLEVAYTEPFSNRVGGPRAAVWLDEVRALLAAQKVKQ